MLRFHVLFTFHFSLIFPVLRVLPARMQPLRRVQRGGHLRGGLGGEKVPVPGAQGRGPGRQEEEEEEGIRRDGTRGLPGHRQRQGRAHSRRQDQAVQGNEHADFGILRAILTRSSLLSSPGFQLCEPSKRLRRCSRFFHEISFTRVQYPDNSTQQVMHCRCPRNSVAYLVKRSAYRVPRKEGEDEVGFQFSFACSPKTVRGGKKEETEKAAAAFSILEN